jgi:hypothetical protein
MQRSVILVDLRIEYWPDRERTASVALRPLDGLALSAVLRAQVQSLSKPLPTAFALHSAHLRDLSQGLPAPARDHTLARMNNLEWVFSKALGQPGGQLVEQIAALAAAVRTLPSPWPSSLGERQEESAEQLLALDPEAPWSPSAREDIEACHPPLHEMSLQSQGLAFLRWLLQRIIPYPCFLWDSYRLAARLRVPHQSLDDALDRNSRLSELLRGVQYAGILSGFGGRRWWRAGVEAALWELTEGRPYNLRMISDALRIAGDLQVEADEGVDLVSTIGPDYAPTEHVSPITKAVRVQPDDWPPYADQAWATISAVQQYPSLRAAVIAEDVPRVNGGPS